LIVNGVDSHGFGREPQVAAWRDEMKLAEMIEGMQIIAKHVEAEARDQYCVQAEHDQFWCGDYHLPLSEDEKKRMEELGWFKDNDSWSCFT
jgi:hypothetical protein